MDEPAGQCPARLPGLPRAVMDEPAGDAQRKWVMSVSKENTQCKSTKISNESKKENICTISNNEEILVEKIRLRISERMDLNADLFNEKIENLKKRVEQLERTNTHEEITKTLLKKVSKLERCIEPVVAARGKVFSKPAVAQNERKGRKLKLINIKEGNHNNSEDFQAISASSSKDPHLAFPPKVAEKFQDPPQNVETKRGFCVKSKGDCTAMGPQRN